MGGVKKMQKIKSKKSLVALLLVAVLGIVGATIAYFTSTDTFENLFGTKPYSMEVVETFESPDDWTPGTTTNKTVVATNKGDVEAAVRVSYTESWVDANGDPLSLTDSATPTPNRAAIINFASDLSTKCPNCGETLHAFALICPTCGMELRSTRPSSAMSSETNWPWKTCGPAPGSIRAVAPASCLW